MAGRLPCAPPPAARDDGSPAVSWFDWLLLTVVAGTCLLLAAWVLLELYRDGDDR